MNVQVHVDLPSGRTVHAGDLEPTFDRSGTRLVTSVFRYAPSFLTERERYPLCPELPLFTGPQTADHHRPIAGAFADTQPDRWGRNLMFAAERHAAAAEDRRPRALDDFDFLLLVPDETRQGALRFSNDDGRTFLSVARPNVPRLVALPALVDAARNLHDDAESDSELALLVDAGTSMGGARPKVTVRTHDGRLALAKLPSIDDRWDVMAWEATALELARRSRIDTPPFELHRISTEESVLVIERFDRTAEGRRVGYLSADSLLQKIMGEVVSYARLAEHLADVSAAPRRDAEELFRRVALTLMVNNVDDHMKNHGLVRQAGGWALSPVFDVNPFRGPTVTSTPLSDTGDPSHRTVKELVDSAEIYGLTPADAADIVAHVERATRDWAQVAQRFGIEPDAIPGMAPAFEHENRAAARAVDTTSAAPSPRGGAAGRQPRGSDGRFSTSGQR